MLTKFDNDTRAPPAYDSAYEAPQPHASPSASASTPTTASHPETLVGAHLPTIIFAIPFPAPIRSHKQPTSPYLLYTLPRAPYEKPGRDAYGRKGKEGLVKKAERKWQEEIAQGERIRLGQEPDAGRWKRFKGKAVGIADGVIHYLPNSRIEALGRVPPKKKLGHLTVLYPADATGPEGSPVTPEFVQFNMNEVLRKTQKRAKYNAVGSACLLPVTALIDLFVVVPIFLFEMNLAYFSTQVSGRSKVAAITGSKDSSISCSPTYDLDAVAILLQATCHRLSPRRFAAGPGSHPGAPVTREQMLNAADAIIATFRQHAIDEVASRHILDREKIADDLKRCCRKAGKEYVKSV